MLESTNSYKNLKKQIQETFDFAIFTSRSVPYLFDEITKEGITENDLKQPYYFRESTTIKQLRDSFDIYELNLSKYLILSSFSFFEDYIKSVFREFIDFQLGEILLQKKIKDKFDKKLKYIEYYEFTPEVREELEKNGFPIEILAKLERLKKSKFENLADFRKSLKKCIEKEEFIKHGNKIIEESKTQYSKIIKSRRILKFNNQYLISKNLIDYLELNKDEKEWKVSKITKNKIDDLITSNKLFYSGYEFLEFLKINILTPEEYKTHREKFLELCFVNNHKDKSRLMEHTQKLINLNAGFPTDVFSYYGILKFIEDLEKMSNRGLSSIIPEILQNVFFFEHPLLNKGTKESFWDIQEFRHKIAHGAIIKKEDLNLKIVSKYNNVLRKLAKEIDKYLIDNFFINEYYYN